jgi:hypothetical protein
MGFLDFLSRLFSSGDDDDAELRAARERHGIKVETPEEQKKREKEEREPYDPWEEVRNARSSFFLGTWASRKFHIIGEDKVKAELEALEKKREEEAQQKKEENSKS